MNKKQIARRITAAVLSLSIVAVQTQYISFDLYAEVTGDSPVDLLNTDTDAELVLSCVKTDESGNARMSLTAETEAGVTNGMFTISYDATKLKLETAEAGEALDGAMTEINTKTDGKIIIGFMSAKPIKSTGSYLNLEFKSLGTNGEEVPVKLIVDEFEGTDETGKDISIKTEAVSGKVTTETKTEVKTAKLTLTDVKTDDSGNARMSLKAETEAGVTNGMFTISYDATKLKLETAEAGEALDGAMTEINTKTDGKIIIGFMSAKPIKSTGSYLNLEFKSLGTNGEEVPVKLIVDEFEGTDETGKDISIKTEAVSGKVTTETKTEVKTAKLTLTDVKTDDSGNARMSLKAETEAGVTNGMFTISYDATKLKLESAEAGEALTGAMTEINTKTDGKIIIGFMSAKPIKPTGSYVDLEFKSLGTNGEEVPVNLIVDEFEGTDETGKDISIKTEAVSGKVTTETKTEVKTAKLTLSDVIPDESGNARMSLNAETEAGVTNGMFTISYDATKLKLETAEAGEALDGAMTEINTKTDGKIIIGFISAEPIKSTGSYIDLEFKSLLTGGEETAVKLSIDEFEGTDETGKDISIKTEAVSGKVKVEIKGEQKPPSVDNDLNGDGVLSVADLLTFKKYILGYEKLTDEALSKADLNKNGKIDVFDFVRMKQLFLV